MKLLREIVVALFLNQIEVNSLKVNYKKDIKVKEILASSKEFNEDMFKTLLCRQDLPHLLLTDVDNLLDGITKDFSDITTRGSLGLSWEGRQQPLLTIDATKSKMTSTTN